MTPGLVLWQAGRSRPSDADRDTGWHWALQSGTGTWWQVCDADEHLCTGNTATCCTVYTGSEQESALNTLSSSSPFQSLLEQGCLSGVLSGKQCVAQHLSGRNTETYTCGRKQCTPRGGPKGDGLHDSLSVLSPPPVHPCVGLPYHLRVSAEDVRVMHGAKGGLNPSLPVSPLVPLRVLCHVLCLP